MKKSDVKSESAVETGVAKKNTAKVTKKLAETLTAPEAIQPEASVVVGSKPATVKKAAKVAESEVTETTTTVDAVKTKPAKPKAQKKTPVAKAEPSTSSPTISVHDRVGLTAGAVWHFLADNGPVPIESLIKSQAENSTIVQRSIGWLAQENKIVLTHVDGVETIALTE